MLLGCIADDLTGATDLALMLVRGGMRTVQVMGVPDPGRPLPEADAVVVALKSRTTPPAQAVEWSTAAARALHSAGARQLFFKYCSTFDSTDEGNIGPVAEALLDLAGGDLTIACPAFPANGRTVYQGHLFVGATLLSDSPMREHPLTPMRDPDLVRVLRRQTSLPVGLVPHAAVRTGAAGVSRALDEARRRGERIVIVDALTDEHLLAIGEACASLPLVTGGSGIAMGLPKNFRAAGLLGTADPVAGFAAPPGPGAILAGSCSAATRSQIAQARSAGVPSFHLDAAALAEDTGVIERALEHAAANLSAERPVLVYSSADPAEVAAVQDRLGRDRSGMLVEQALARIAVGLMERGVTRLVVAGGETSGAVVGALGVTALEIGPEIAPGVPWTRALDGSGLALALKSGNFGGPDFFIHAWEML